MNWQQTLPLGAANATEQRQAWAEIEQLGAKVEELQGQLPEGMEHCTIRFIKCEKGHGRLTADNWVDHGCPYCKIDRWRDTFQCDDPVDAVSTSGVIQKEMGRRMREIHQLRSKVEGLKAELDTSGWMRRVAEGHEQLLMKAKRSWCYDRGGRTFQFVAVEEAAKLEAEIEQLRAGYLWLEGLADNGGVQIARAEDDGEIMLSRVNSNACVRHIDLADLCLAGAGGEPLP